MMSLHLEYFYDNEAEQFIFYRIPKALFPTSVTNLSLTTQRCSTA